MERWLSSSEFFPSFLKRLCTSLICSWFYLSIFFSNSEDMIQFVSWASQRGSCQFSAYSLAYYVIWKNFKFCKVVKKSSVLWTWKFSSLSTTVLISGKSRAEHIHRNIVYLLWLTCADRVILCNKQCTSLE